MRLVGGADFHSGRVELFYYGSWGTICAADDLSTTSTPHYTMNIANVICRMLGFPRALSYECCGHYGQGLGGIFLDTPQMHWQGSQHPRMPAERSRIAQAMPSFHGPWSNLPGKRFVFSENAVTVKLFVDSATL